MAQYEYMVGAVKQENTNEAIREQEDILNECGEFGWELVSIVVEKQTLISTAWVWFYLKREKQDNIESRIPSFAFTRPIMN